MSILKELLGSGGARNAGDSLDLRQAFRDYRENEIAAGRDPKPFKEWKKQHASSQ